MMTHALELMGVAVIECDAVDAETEAKAPAETGAP